MGCGWEFFFSMILKRGEQAESTSLWARTMSPSQTCNTEDQHYTIIYLFKVTSACVCMCAFWNWRIKYWAYSKYFQMLVLDSEWSGERDVWLFVCKTLAIYNKSGAYLGAIKWDFINNAKRGRALCIGYVWMFGKWIIYFFPEQNFPSIMQYLFSKLFYLFKDISAEV